MATSSSITFAAVVQGSSNSQIYHADRNATTTTVLRLLDDHQPYDLINDTALSIVDETYAALRQILGPDAPPPNRHVEIIRPVDPADPDSPLLSVNASATHCCVCMVNSPHCGTTSDYRKYISPKQKSTPQYTFASCSVSVRTGTLHVYCADGHGDGWKRARIPPNVSEKGLFGVLETITSRLDAAIQIESNLIEKVREIGCKSPKVNDIITVRMVLEKMRVELDLDAIMRRRRQKRRSVVVVQENTSQPDAAVVDDADALVKRLRTLHV